VIDPDNPPRWWTADEANAELGRVSEAVERAQAAARAPRGNGHGPAARQQLTDAVAELEADGIVLRDVGRGLVDFPARASNGKGYWLCWLAGEPEVTWWHWPEDGFAGRTPLDRAP
jgi:Uncharacterized conserved protein (DUF2203)